MTISRDILIKESIYLNDLFKGSLELLRTIGRNNEVSGGPFHSRNNNRSADFHVTTQSFRERGSGRTTEAQVSLRAMPRPKLHQHVGGQVETVETAAKKSIEVVTLNLSMLECLFLSPASSGFSRTVR